MTKHDPTGKQTAYPAGSTAESRAAEPILVVCTVCGRKDMVEDLKDTVCSACGTTVLFAKCTCGFRWAMSRDRAGQTGNCPGCGKVMQYPGIDRSTMGVMMWGLASSWILAALTYGVLAFLAPPATFTIPLIVGGVLSIVVISATFLS